MVIEEICQDLSWPLGLAAGLLQRCTKLGAVQQGVLLNSMAADELQRQHVLPCLASDV